MGNPTDPNRQGPRYVGAPTPRWPDGQPLCGGDKGHDEHGEHKGYCHKTAGAQTPHLGVGSCNNHGGNTPTQVIAGQRKLAAAAVVTYGAPREIDRGGRPCLTG